jgi:hypothetical protein
VLTVAEMNFNVDSDFATRVLGIVNVGGGHCHEERRLNEKPRNKIPRIQIDKVESNMKAEFLPLNCRGKSMLQRGA